MCAQTDSQTAEQGVNGWISLGLSEGETPHNTQGETPHNTQHNTKSEGETPHAHTYTAQMWLCSI